MAGRLIFFRSTATARLFSSVSAAAASSTGGKSKSLHKKLLDRKIRPNSDTNITGLIDEWANQGKQIKRSEIIDQINFFRSRKSYHFALQLSEWQESSKFEMKNVDHAIRIDLLGKTRGTHSAEMYFDRLPESAKTTKTYGALLNCYCKDKLLDKALELFTEMKMWDCISTLNYNNLIALHMNTNQPEKVPLLVQEMEQRKIKADIFTYNLLINSYAARKDLDAVDKVLEDVKAKDVKFDWFTYGNVATIYINAGLLDKATSFIQKMEMEMKNVHDREYFHTLIILYKDMSDLSGVNCTWEALKSVFPSPSNTSYLMRLLALSKLGDVEGLEECFREWESNYSMYDVRLTNVLLESYLNRNMIKEADALYKGMVAKGKEPNLRTMSMLAHYHITNFEIYSALKYLEMGAASVNVGHNDNWFPNDETIQMFLKYFEEKNDADGAKQFCDILKRIDRLDSTVCESLLSSDVSAHEVQAQS